MGRKVTLGSLTQNAALIRSLHVLGALCRCVHYLVESDRSLGSYLKEVSVKGTLGSLHSVWKPQHSEQFLSVKHEGHQSLVLEMTHDTVCF